MADFVDIKKLEAAVNADILASSVEIRKAITGNYSYHALFPYFIQN